MSLLLVIAVAVVVILYIRTTKRARLAWLTRVDLPGRWRCEVSGDQSAAWALTLHGGVDGGEFVLREGAQEKRGQWHIVGHTLTMRSPGSVDTFDLHYFKTGSIGLEDDSGARRILTKVTDNVVPLRSLSGD